MLNPTHVISEPHLPAFNLYLGSLCLWVPLPLPGVFQGMLAGSEAAHRPSAILWVGWAPGAPGLIHPLSSLC